MRDAMLFGLRLLGVPKAEALDRITTYLKQMNHEGCEAAYPHPLSSGIQQRIAIARTYVLNPVVLPMDEPFGELDSALTEPAATAVRALARASRAIVRALSELPTLMLGAGAIGLLAALADGSFGGPGWVEERALSEGAAAFDDQMASRVAAAKSLLRPGA